jgi:hypothetical protein
MVQIVTYVSGRSNPGNRRNQRLCDMTLSKLVKELGEPFTPMDSFRRFAIG